MDDRELAWDRRRKLDQLVKSSSRLKVVVAGPGTGKTHSFRVLLEQETGEGIVLTFINNLVEDLERRLGHLARVETLHGLARWMLHSNLPAGLTARFKYYPLMKAIHAEDVSLMIGIQTSEDDVEAVFQTLEEDEILSWSLRSGNYYDAVGYTDSIYRLLKHLAESPEAMPRFDQVIVDEFQDFNALEVEFIEQIYARSPTLIVGDDDQALYSFKHASPNYLRAIAGSTQFERFELPYSSRCTEVLVHAVRRVVTSAQGEGLLEGRLDHPYICYLPDKREDSEAYPKVIHAACTVHTKPSPLMGRYIEGQLAGIPPKHVAESWQEGYATALVIGPSWLARIVFTYLDENLPNVTLKMSEPEAVDPLDAYELLREDDQSRLGWRLLLLAEQPGFRAAVIRQALGEQADLTHLLPAGYRERHLEIVALLKRARQGEELDHSNLGRLADASKRSIPELRVALHMEEEPPKPEPDETKPSVVVTSQVGAKGMQAAHVFVVGLNETIFPATSPPTDDEVCQFIVALTRATRSCHLISATYRLGNLTSLPTSRFVTWLGDDVATVVVNADSFERHS